MYALFIGDVDDPHITRVRTYLEDRGHGVEVWDFSRLLETDMASIYPDNSKEMCVIKGNTLSFDLVWLRKWSRPNLSRLVDLGERDFIDREVNGFIEGFLTRLDQMTVMTNSFSSFIRANSKSFQLQLAASLNFPIPRTIISNDARKIAEFIKSESPNRCIYKPLTRSWIETNRGRMVIPTTLIDIGHLQDIDPVSLSPGIYQRAISKTREVRAIVFGEYCIATEIYPDSCGDLIDWRIFYLAEGARPIRLPKKIEEFCRSMMSSLGIEFAAFDFAIDDEGIWIFLELNEAGNFSQQENLLPELRISECFSVFLESRCINSDS